MGRVGDLIFGLQVVLPVEVARFLPADAVQALEFAVGFGMTPSGFDIQQVSLDERRQSRLTNSGP